MADLRLHIGDEEPLLLSNAEFFPSSGLFRWQNQDAFKSGNTPFSNGATLKVRIIEADPILTITAVKRPVRFLNYEEVGVRPALVDFQVSRTGLWLNAMPFKLTFAQAASLGLPPGPGEWTFSAGNRIRHIQQNLPYNEHWAGNRDCAAEDCTKPTAVTYRLEECPECGYVLADPREATVDVISTELQLGGDDEEEENTQPLTARFEDLPTGGHGGAGTPFTFRLVFSEAVSATPEGLRDHALTVNNATLEAVSRVDGRSDLWEIRLTPGSNAMVTAALLPAADCDAAGAVCTASGKMLAHGIGFARQGPPNSSATGAPAIRGKARVGETLTADTSGISDADGLTNVTFSYQWLADDADIAGATGSTLTLTDAYAGKTVRVEVFFTDDADHEEALTSAATAAVDTPATGAPTISGTPQLGQTLTLDISAIADADGLTNVTFSYQWLADDADIAGATGSTLTLTDAYAGKTVRVKVSFTDDADHEEARTSAATAAVDTPATGLPTISGMAEVGQTLTADTSGIADADGLGNVAFTYQWVAGGSDIDGATASSYTLTASEEGQTIQAQVTFTDNAGSVEALTSAATAAVAPLPAWTASFDPANSWGRCRPLPPATAGITPPSRPAGERR